MKQVLRAMCVLAVLAVAVPVWAQQPAATPSPSVDSWYAGVNTGVGVVEKFGGVFGAEAGVRVWKNLDLVGELFWSGNVVTRRQLDNIELLAAHLQSTRGGSATGTLKVPAFYGGVGGRWVFEQDAMLRPYVILTLGGASTDLKPTLTLQGTDITDTASQYGLTLGSDVIGKSSSFATEFGLGVLWNRDAWYADAGARLLSIATEGQRTNVARLVLGGGYRF
jgi:hypothetical protein